MILAAVAVLVLGAAVVGVVLTAGPSDVSDAGAAVPDTTTPTVEVVQVAAELPDLEGDLGQNAAESDTSVEPERADGGCTIGALSVRLGSSGDGVACLQDALRVEGFYDGDIDGEFGDSTLAAVRDYQTANDLFVDGVVGRESAIELEVWPDEESLVTHTPPPAPGATDLWGVELSPVASAGDDAPPLPENSGSGKRVVYDRAGQRVWAVSDDEQIIRSWLVSGSKSSNEQPGTHTVYSRSEMSTAWNGKAWLPNMIRYQKTDIGHIGFHGIPLHVADNSPYMTTDQLGTRLSGGCQRQHNLDAQFMWGFATVGTTVVVT
jgi:peptidoglycan hydrolase-like protein with peptidoglycan-binding domain